MLAFVSFIHKYAGFEWRLCCCFFFRVCIEGHVSKDKRMRLEALLTRSIRCYAALQTNKALEPLSRNVSIDKPIFMRVKQVRFKEFALEMRSTATAATTDDPPSLVSLSAMRNASVVTMSSMFYAIGSSKGASAGSTSNGLSAQN